jgi:uncharacterized glyoxalase superfamily protein PhnB
MQANVTEPGGTVVPTLRYRDVAAAIDWLCNALGFDKQLVVNGDDGAVRYAELAFGNGMIMLGPAEGSGLDRFMTQPADTGGVETQICYLFVADAIAHCARAKAAGAEIVFDIDDAQSNGRGYSCRDPQGHVWNIGTYDPWKRQPAPAGGASRQPAGPRGGLRRLAVLAGLAVVVAAFALVAGWTLGLIDVDDLGLRSAASASVAEAVAGTHQDEQVGERDGHEAAERAVKAAKEQLARERGEKEAVERAVRSVRDQLGHERAARQAAERTAREVQAELAREQSARENAERAVKQADAGHALENAQRIAQETRERLSLAERASEAVQKQLAAERSAREAAEVAAQRAREQTMKERAAKDAVEHAARAARERTAKWLARIRAAQSLPPRRRPIVNWDQ